MFLPVGVVVRRWLVGPLLGGSAARGVAAELLLLFDDFYENLPIRCHLIKEIHILIPP